MTGLVTEVSQLNARARAGEERMFFPFYFLFGHIINNLLIELGRSVWENLNLNNLFQFILKQMFITVLIYNGPNVHSNDFFFLLNFSLVWRYP